MPQMAPMNYLSLFFLFILIFMLFNPMNYFIYKMKMLSSLLAKHKKIQTNWKW